MTGKTRWLMATFLAPAMAAAWTAMPCTQAHAGGKSASFTVANVEYEGTKLFVPPTLVVKKGDQVKITILNNIPSDPPNHGFAIPDFGVETVVNRGEPQTVEFTADKTGIFDIKCQLHPAHVHGQLVVQE